VKAKSFFYASAGIFLLVAACCMISALVSGCSATLRGTIPADRSTAVEAAVKVAGKIGMAAQKGPVDALVHGEISGTLWGTLGTAKMAPAADLFVQTGGPNGYKATGAIYLAPAGADTVRYEALFATDATVGADAIGGLFCELVRQQVQLDRGKQAPRVNLTKSSGAFVGWSMLTPVAGLHYTMKGNPYGTGSTRPWFYAISALGDVVMVGLLTGAALVDDSDTQSALVIAGVSTGLGWRLISLLGLQDVWEYNAIARTDFDLDAAVRSLDAPSDR
jgi:hypothetical protein